jgi:hypothetical protein
MHPPDATPPTEPELAEALTGLGYVELFQRGDETALDTIWSRPDAPARLRRLTYDPAAPARARFLAAEALFARDPTFPAGADLGPLARLYAEALRLRLTGAANPWGLPGELDGPVAGHVLALGEVAAPPLSALLTDDSDLRYSGSKEATVGNSYGYRVKDVAAALIAELRGLRFPVHTDPRRRDVEIDRLRRLS